MDVAQPSLEAIAITGFSFRMPQDAVDETSLWSILENGTNVKTRWPTDRTNTDAFHEDGSRKPNTLPSHFAHFVTEDPGAFDAPFFSITAKEASSMSPRQRQALEIAYHTFESAGIPVESLRGSLTAVYGASMTDDWSLMTSKDAESVPRMSITGNASSLLPNKISWFFDLRGPSVHVDTACSSGLTALDLACQSILSGNARTALVVGSSTLLSPETSLHLANLNFLSPDGCCYSFDARANGYGRGEGIVALYLKPLLQAVYDGDVVRAVVRATASNQDGRTPGLTQPNSKAQVELILQTYAKAGLNLSKTRYVEAHGTGTALGDPLEAKAIGRVFRKERSPADPLYMGSIKANVGHLEGSSGPASVVKAIMMLERGIIPPQALFDTLNPAIDAAADNLKIPTAIIPWPQSGLRRISVNSFGFGGANAHTILDDALHYMETRGLHGFYRSIKDPMSVEADPNGSVLSPTDEIQCTGQVAINDTPNGTHALIPRPRLLVWSAADEPAIHRMLQAYGPYYTKQIAGRHHKLAQLAYTLAARRSIMPWRSFAITESNHDIAAAKATNKSSIDTLVTLPIEKPVRANFDKTGIAFVFTGQGAQYAGMGLVLMSYDIFRRSLQRSDETFRSLGCGWSLFDAICDQEKVNRPEYSQPLCTALQIALVELLQSFGVKPTAVVGHSSGEIAAAYTVGSLTHEGACKVAYFRGKFTALLVHRTGETETPGAMLSANLREDEVQNYLEGLGVAASNDSGISLACVNSPKNVTLSGPAELIDIVQADLEKKSIFAQKLNTGVAYHSPAMRAIAKEYAASIGLLEERHGSITRGSITMVSSVTGEVLGTECLATSQYWIDNLVSPVRFADALSKLTDSTTTIISDVAVSSTKTLAFTDVVEIGPHATLKRSVKETLPQLRYHVCIQRSSPGLYSTLKLVGILFCLGYPVSIAAANGQDQGKNPYLVDCPAYPFDRSRRYWDESRLSKNWRLREASWGFLLGRRVHDWNPLRPRWRNWLCVETIPWLGEHNVTGTLVVPGTGSIVIGIEAARRTVARRNRKISGFQFKNVELLSPLLVGYTARDAVETDVHLDQIRTADEKESTWFQLRIFSHSDGLVTETFNAQIQVQFESETSTPSGHEKMLEDERIRSRFQEISSSCTQPLDTRTFYNRFLEYGFKYGPTFTVVSDVSFDPIGQASATGKVNWDPAVHEQVDDSPVHPGILDGVVQVLLATVPKGFKDTSTMVPRRIGKIWISSKVWSQVTKSVNVASAFTETPDEGVPLLNFWALADDNTPLCLIENAKCSEISRAETPEDHLVARRLLYSIEWKPRLSSLAPGELQKICDNESTRLDTFDSEANTMARVFPKIELAVRSAAMVALQTMSTSKISGRPAYFSKYVDSLIQRYASLPVKLNNQENGTDLSPLALEALLQECEVEYPPWLVFPAVARALPSILCGETDPLELMFATNAAKAFYANVYKNHMLSGGFQTFINLASHENPRLRILEVGAGTGSFTGHIISSLQAIENEKGGTAFAEYVFTDISASFFSNAQAQFKEHLGRMSFKTWNLEHDPVDAQSGLDVRGYDIIFAGSVLHAVSNLSKSLRHLQKLLKPGGYLVFQEITSPQVACVNIGFGTLEGWWLSTEKWRQNGPLVTLQHWNQLLLDNGFRGIDLALKDFEDEAHHISTIMVAQACRDGDAPIQNGPMSAHRAQNRLVVVTDQGSSYQKSLSEVFGIQGDLKEVVDFDRIEQGWKAAPGDVVVCIIDVQQSRLASLAKPDFKRFQQLIQGSKNVLWVVASMHGASTSEDSDGYLPWDPLSGIATGTLRTIRSEESDKHIVTLTINQAHIYNPDDMASRVTEIIGLCFNEDTSRNSPEVEFVIQNGHITVGRMVYEKQLDEERKSHLRPNEQTQKWEASSPLMLEVERPGMLDSLRFVEDTTYHNDLAVDDVEIEAEAWPLSFRDILIALGKTDYGTGIGWECAGKVTRVGAACRQHFKPGDRVVMPTFGSAKSHPRSKMDVVQKIPDSLSYIDAVSHVNPSMTSWHGLVNVARLKRGEKVLIHSAAGAIGQMAIGVATMIGAEIFATVGSNEKKRLLVDEFNIPEDHIFHSRDTSFAQGIMRVTDGYGVDVILNSLAGESLRASWECIAPFGRFIELGKADIIANSSLPMGMFAKNVTFAAVDLVSIVKKNTKLANELLTETMRLISNGSLRGPRPLHLHPFAEAEKAFRFMQSGNSTGRIILTKSKDDQITKHTVYRSTWRFDADATYVIIGGFGGLGRVMIDWMVRKGARNLLVLSRSGASSQAASDLVSRLRDQHISIAAPTCDVSCTAQLAKLLEDYSVSMPQSPIKGCIHSAMVLQDAVFSNMTHDQWTGTLLSKVQSSWNLHTLLPRNMDFFIMLSSLIGIYGAMGQTNYAAGCAFQDTLARARTESNAYRGISVSLDLGWLLNDGIVSEREDYKRKWQRAQDIAGVRTADLIAVLDHFCDPATHSAPAPSSSGSCSRHSQLLVGALTPSDMTQRGEMIPTSMSWPLLDAFRTSPGRSSIGADTLASSESQEQSPKARFRLTTSFDERCNVVKDALKGNLARALDITVGDVDLDRPVSSYGVDSLMAVELRNWMRKDYDVNISVFEILGGTTVVGLSLLVVAKAEELQTVGES